MSRLIYKNPADWDWNFALPIGNGKLGAMIFGNHQYERLSLNEDSLWYGDELHRINKDAYPYLEKVRNLLFDGKVKEAEELILHSFTGNPPSQRPYQPLGDLYIKYCDIDGECSDYERCLDLDTAVHSVRKTYKDTCYIEECFAHYKRNVIVIKITSSNNSDINLDIDAGRMCFYDKAYHDDNNVYFLGNMPGRDYSFCGGVSVEIDCGTKELIGQYIRIRNAKSVVIYFTAATSFRELDPLNYVKNTLNNVSDENYYLLVGEHLNDYRSLFGKVEFDLKYDKELDKLTTDERLKRFDENNPDNGLIKTYFDYGRYLLISCSRPGSLPANLQGVWCKDIDPPWGCKYTVNINTQMNYWPAEMFGLGDCHLPLFLHMKRMQANGQITAKEMYNCRGTVCHHNTDLWGDTAPQDQWIPGTYWVMSMPWLITHIYSHYEYTKDIRFLEEMYPIIKDSVLFFLDFLVEKEGNVYIVPSVSPENTYIMPNGEKGSICISSTMDNEILRDLFEIFIKAYDILEDDDDGMLYRTKNYLKKIPPIKIGKHGQIMEWLEDYEEAEPGHRHISQLYGLHPSHQIDYVDTPELCEAASKTIERRLSYGGGHTGWSRAWIMNMFARLRDRDACYSNLVALLKKSTLNNLFDNHPPFQIDGNFGSIAAIGEMLIQCKDSRVDLLPALPDEFDSGSISNICVPGGAKYSLKWANGRLTEFSVLANRDNYHAIVNYLDKTFKLDMAQGEFACFEIH